MSVAEARQPELEAAYAARNRSAGLVRVARGVLGTGVLILLMLAALDVAITRTPILYGELSIEHSLDLRVVHYVQTLKALRKLRAGPVDDAERVLLLGDSRIWFAAREAPVEQEVARLLPGRRVRVENLGIFGTRIGDFEALSRHLEELHPTAVLLALGGEELLRDPERRLGTLPTRILDQGWRDGPLSPRESGGRLDRWLRTIWPLYRLRALVRIALRDRLLPEPHPPPPFPDSLGSVTEFFEYLHHERAADVETAYAMWRRSKQLPEFLHYLKVAGSLRQRVEGPPEAPGLDVESERALDRLLERLGNAPWASKVVLMPQNPILEQEEAADYRPPGSADEVVAAIRTAAARHDVEVVDGRRWVPAGGFFDAVHVLPNFGAFQEPFAREVARAVTQGRAAEQH